MSEFDYKIISRDEAERELGRIQLSNYRYGPIYRRAEEMEEGEVLRVQVPSKRVGRNIQASAAHKFQGRIKASVRNDGDRHLVYLYHPED